MTAHKAVLALAGASLGELVHAMSETVRDLRHGGEKVVVLPLLLIVDYVRDCGRTTVREGGGRGVRRAEATCQGLDAR